MSFRAARQHAAEKEAAHKFSSGPAATAAASSAPATAAPPSTRLCVKNLPVHVKEDRLRKIFGAQGEVTDVKLLKTADGRSRKMAFVGFRSLEDSAKALAHFNRTFVDTSKIDVEYAVNPREAKEALRPWSKYSEGSSRHDAHHGVGAYAPEAGAGGAGGKDGDAASDPKAQRQSAARSNTAFSKSALFGLADDSQLAKLMTDPKFHEYLHVMGSRSKNKFWSNNAADLQLSGSGSNKPANMLTDAEEMAAVRGEQTYQTYEQYLAEQRAESKKKGGKGAADVDSDDDDDAFNQPMLDRDVDDVATPAAPTTTKPAKASSKAKAAAAADDDADAPVAVNPVALNSAISDLDYLKTKQAGAKDFDDDSDSDDEPAPAAAAASAADATAAAKSADSKKRKLADAGAAAPSDSAAAEGEGEDDEGDAELRAEYEREQSAATSAAAVQESEYKDAQDMLDSGRLFLRNLSYTVTEADLRALFEPFGAVAEVHVPLDDLKKPKGFAYVSFMFPAHALAAQRSLDGNFFLGRLLHILNSRPKPAVKSEWEQLQAMGDDAKNAVTYKKKKELEMKAHAASRKDQASWNTLFIRSDTVTDSIAAKYGLAKSDIMDTTGAEGGAGMAVRLALAETQLINETKRFLNEHGVDTAVFDAPKSSTQRSDTAIIVKNIPFNTELDEVRRLFAKYGSLGHVVMPPSKAMVLLEFLEANDAKNAFKNLAYKKFKYVPLYLEWAPKGAFERGAGAAPAAAAAASSTGGVVEGKNKASELLQAAAPSSGAGDADDGIESSTVYVKNLNFNTTEASLKALFAAIAPVRSVSISKKKNTKARPGTSDPAFLSMGYGFVEFRKKEDALKAIAALQGAQLDNHALDVKLSSRGATGAAKPAASQAATAAAAATAASGGAAPSSKLLVKNVPFETTARELRDLFSSFGSIQRIRLPKKFGQLGHRGFAFIDFVTKNEAKNALENVKHSHLYGRHLVIEYAAPTVEHDSQDVDELRKKTATQYEAAQQGAPPNKKRKVDQGGDEIDEAFDKQFK